MPDHLLEAYNDTIAIFNNEIHKLQPKIDSHTLTPGDQRYIDYLRENIAKIEADRAKYVKKTPLNIVQNILIHKIFKL